MLSSGTRIGSARIDSWLGDGSCGQSYQCEQTEGEGKGEKVFVKLMPRDLAERKGFGDYFLQECQALEQLEGTGIWPIKKFGIMKWKHWIYYPWHQGHALQSELPPESEDYQEPESRTFIRSLSDQMANSPEEISPEVLLQIMTQLHQGLGRAHQSGVVHGNLKPRNILISYSNEKGWLAWVTEFGLWKLKDFGSQIGQEGGAGLISLNLETQKSLNEAANFRPPSLETTDLPNEKWDLFALGRIVEWILESHDADNLPIWKDWLAWARQSTSAMGFETMSHSMQAMPGMDDISEYGMKIDSVTGRGSGNSEEIRLKREKEWNLNQRIDTLRFRRNMTGLVGAICLLASLSTSLYTYFFPTPWTEYSMDGILDSYQLGFGFFGGQAWGIVPAAYDDEDKGGQNVVGEWVKEDNLFKLSFRKFKLSPKEEGDKKLWQFIGTGKTSSEDYHNWSDFLRFDRSRDLLFLVKRVDEYDEYRPGKIGNSSPRLFAADRFQKGGSKIQVAELAFAKSGGNGVSWSLFFSLGFLLSCSIYNRELKKVEIQKLGND